MFCGLNFKKGDTRNGRIYANPPDNGRERNWPVFTIVRCKKTDSRDNSAYAPGQKCCPIRQREESKNMMDLFMIGTLLVSFGLVWLLVKWCQKQVEEQE